MPQGFDVRAFSESLSCDDTTGIWKAECSSPISYPEQDNAACFQLEDKSFWFRHRNRCITAAVRQFPPGGYILDIGGGNGFVARALIDVGYQTVLLEPGVDGASNARTHRRIPHVINATFEDAGPQRGAVPAAGLFDVLEHIEDDGGFLQRLGGALQDGGVVYLTVPAFQWLWSTTDVEAGHYRRYRIADLRRTFEIAGFEVLYVTYFFELPLLPFFLMRTLPYALGLARRRAPADYQAEHTAGAGRLSEWLQRLLAREVDVIENRRSLMTGTSCLLVARKRS